MLDFLAIDLQNFDSIRPAVETLLHNANVSIEDNGLVYARNILARAFHIQYLTIPNTQSTSSLRTGSTYVIKRYNGHVRSEAEIDMRHRMIGRRKPPIFLHIATPGTINKKLDVTKFHQDRRRNVYNYFSLQHPDTFEEDRVEVIGGASEGILGFCMHALTYAIAAKMNFETPKLAIDPHHIVLNSPDKIPILGKKQITLLDTINPAMTHVLDIGRNLPIQK
jgi:hypothetical protein